MRTCSALRFLVITLLVGRGVSVQAESALDRVEHGLQPHASADASPRADSPPARSDMLQELKTGRANAKQEDDDFWGDFWGGMFLGTIKLAAMIPMAVVDRFGDHDFDQAEHVAIRGAWGAADHGIHAYGVEGRGMPIEWLGVSAGYQDYFTGNGASRDHLNLSRANLRLQYGTLRNGVAFEAGAQWLRGGIRDRSGVNLGLTFDLSPHERYLIDATYRFGTLGSRSTNEFSAGISYVFGHAEVRAGYRYFDIGSSTLKGPEIGVGVRF